MLARLHTFFGNSLLVTVNPLPVELELEGKRKTVVRVFQNQAAIMKLRQEIVPNAMAETKGH